MLRACRLNPPQQYPTLLDGWLAPFYPQFSVIPGFFCISNLAATLQPPQLTPVILQPVAKLEKLHLASGVLVLGHHVLLNSR